jgi:hypothetical protein
MSFPPPRESASNWGAGQGGGSSGGYPTGTMPMSRMTSAGMPMSGYATSYTSQQFPVVSLPSSPSYPSAGTRGLPPRRVLETMARRRPRWGLRFMFLLILAGGAAYAGRKVIPGVDERISKVEITVRELGRQYGFIDGSPAPLVRPSGNLSETSETAEQRTADGAPATSGVALARAAAAGKAGNGRPDIQPLGQPAGGPGKPAAPISAAAAGRPGSVPAAAVRGHGRRRLSAGAATAPRARFRRRLAARRASTAAANAATAALNAKPVVAAPVAGAVPAAKEAPAEKPAPAKSDAVKAAASSGDELDQLMASAVGPAPAKSDLDKKLSTVQKGEAGVKAVKPAGSGPQPLGRNEIQTVMKDVQSQMGECMRKTGQGGPVDVKVTVAADGDVTSTLIKGAMAGTPTGACVESKLKATVFPPSAGQAFDYRLIVR